MEARSSLLGGDGGLLSHTQSPWSSIDCGGKTRKPDGGGANRRTGERVRVLYLVCFHFSQIEVFCEEIVAMMDRYRSLNSGRRKASVEVIYFTLSTYLSRVPDGG